MGLILGQKDIRQAFESAWTASYVLGLLLYGQRSKKKALKDIYDNRTESDMLIITLATSPSMKMTVLITCR